MNSHQKHTEFFRYDVRVLACKQCGAPLEAALPGNLVKCQYCKASLQVATRDDRAVLDTSTQPDIDEEERLRRLRSQDAHALRPPADLLHLFRAGGLLDPNRIQETLSIWNETRAKLTDTEHAEREERLYFLTLVLNQNLQDDSDGTHRKRALLESALDVLHIPRHRQVLLCTLARLAVFDEDLKAADAWLASCDPRSDDLETDSHYRFAKAFLHTARGQWQEVLDILGQDAGTIPIHDALEAISTLLRANAHERSGNPAMAIELLDSSMKTGGPHIRSFLDSAIVRYEGFQLCPNTYSRARQVYPTQSEELSDPMGMKRFYVLIGLLLVVCLAALIIFWFEPF